jgi:thiol-disulfide isomerase/thioredoxin
MPVAEPQAPNELLVVCLCAEWCGVCREYRSRFEQVKAAVQVDLAQAQFLWVDVEDEADLLHPLDVEDFPTLLIALGDKPYFLGPLTPQAQTLERMIRTTVQDPGATGLTDPALAQLVKKIRGLGLPQPSPRS